MTNHEIPPDLVQKELYLILNSDEMKNSQLLAKFLEYVVQEKLSGNEEKIKEYTIGVKALGRPSDFNPQLDAIVRIHAGRLRRAISQYYHGPGKNDPVFISIPKGTYVPSFENRSATNYMATPAATGWELPPELTNSHAYIKRNNYKPILAVIPFRNLSLENSMDFFVTGIGEQLCIDLARFNTLSIISYYSTDKYDLSVSDLRKMKTQLGVDYVLTGSARFADETVRMNIQLLLPENGSIAWSETYTRHLTPSNIFDIQLDVTDQVLNAIADCNGVLIKKNQEYISSFESTEALNVHEAMYQYYSYISDYDLEKLPGTIKALEKAIQVEPHNALIPAMLADLHVDQYIISTDTNIQLLELAMNLAQAAVSIDKDCQYAQKSLAWTYLFLGKKEKCKEAVEYCIQLNPKSSTVMCNMGLICIQLGDYAKGFKLLVQSIHLNPAIHPPCKYAFALYYFSQGNYEESLKWLLRLHPLSTPFLSLLLVSLKGRMNEDVIEVGEDVMMLKGQFECYITRRIFDPVLIKDIMVGLKAAGLAGDK